MATVFPYALAVSAMGSVPTLIGTGLGALAGLRRSREGDGDDSAAMRSVGGGALLGGLAGLGVGAAILAAFFAWT